MKLIYILLLTLFTCGGCSNQSTTIQSPVQEQFDKQTTIVKLIIKQAILDGFDHSEIYISNDVYFVMYESEYGQTHFSKYFGKIDKQSYGIIKVVRSEEVYETSDSYKGEKLSFAWSYVNSYDDESGVCFVRLCIIYKPSATEFELIVINEEDMSKSIYTGIVEGGFRLKRYSPFRKK